MVRRQRGEGSVYQRSDGQWVATLDLGWRDGIRRRKVLYGRTQKIAIKKLNDAKRDVATHGDIPTAGTTLEKWLRTWLEDICPTKQRMRPKTLRDYRSWVEQYIIPPIGKTRIDKLGPAHVRAVRAYVINDKGLSSTTAMHAHAALSVALNDAMREGIISRNVAELVERPPKEPGTQRSLSMPEVTKLLKHVEPDRYGSRWLAGLLLGARQGELLGLEWNRLDLQDGTVDLSWQLQRIPYTHGCNDPCGKKPYHCPAKKPDVLPGFEYRQLDGNLCLQRPKTDKSTRLIPLPPPLVTALEMHHKRYLLERVGYGTDHGLVWPRPDGRPTAAKSDGEAWKAHLKAVGIEPTKQHAARHTTATLLLAIGVPQEIIMSILGHSEAVTTRGYQHVDLTMQRAALAQLASKLE
jgi:integrase